MFHINNPITRPFSAAVAETAAKGHTDVGNNGATISIMVHVPAES